VRSFKFLAGSILDNNGQVQPIGTDFERVQVLAGFLQPLVLCDDPVEFVNLFEFLFQGKNRNRLDSCKERTE
jgi:hypothetical protein